MTRTTPLRLCDNRNSGNNRRFATGRPKQYWASAFLAALAVAGVLHLPASTDPLADLKNAVAASDAGRYPAAAAALESLKERLPQLADYVAWFLASAQSRAKNPAAVPKTLEAVFSHQPSSPLVPRAAILSAEAFVEAGQPQPAADLLRRYYSQLPQPQGDLALAKAFAASGDPLNAAVYYQRVYFGFPVSAEAALADAESNRLRAQLAERYPPPMPHAMLDRALKLLASGQNDRGVKELESLIPQLGGAERDLAQVRIGVARYNGNQTQVAQRYLAALKVDAPEADAERLYYLVQSARRLNAPAEMNQILEDLSRRYPDSPWRMQALIAVANSLLSQNQADAYEPLYQACYDSFRADSQAAYCHWRVVWSHYIRRKSDAADLLRAHVNQFPASEQASAALYFLGRLAEEAREPAVARAYYEEIAREYPNLYYGTLSRDRLDRLPPAPPSTTAVQFLRAVSFPSRSRTRDFNPNAVAKARIERARMLTAAGLRQWAEGELRFGADKDDQPHVFAMELASLIGGGKPDQGIRYIKRYASGYNYFPVDSAPLDFWRLAFPLPYRSDLERFSRQYEIDPFLMAALIRQESEFDTRAVSRADARGLTQIRPATGRELSRRLKLKGYSTVKLFQPSLNLQFGAYYLKLVANQSGGKMEVALAAYNAGLSRAKTWITWADFREPAEFIETVPFTETRGYIQAVLRNADIYRRVYGVSTQQASSGRATPQRAAPR